MKLITTVSVLIALLLTACTPPPTHLPQPTATVPQPTATAPAPTPTAAPLPLSAAGPYFPGKRTYTLEDASYKTTITVWYPAIKPDGYAGTVARNADSDPSGAPYPLLLSSSQSGNTFAPHLASYGFVIAGVENQGPSRQWGQWLIDYPIEILYVLDWIGSKPLEGLENMVDADNAGALGYSFDGYNALALSGARADPAYYLDQCAQAHTMDPAPEPWWIDYICTPVDHWEDFTAHAGEALTVSDDGLWQPLTDERIRAVMPMAPEGAWLFGERGLAAVDRPTLIIGATEDKDCPYDWEAVYIFEHLGTPDRVMISFIGQKHLMVFNFEPIAQMSHFAVAFFGYHLQGHADYAKYFSEEFVTQYSDLAWGVYHHPD